MRFDLQVLALTLFVAVMAIAAFEDFRRLVIPNLLPALLCAAWPGYFSAAPSLYGAIASVGGAVVVFLAGAALFARGYLGGGDVKLLSVAALWAGPAGLPALLLLTAVLGGGLALFLLLPLGGQLALSARMLLGQPAVPAARGLAMPVPYGVAIAGAALVVVVSPYLG